MSNIENIPKLINSSPEALKEGIKDINLKTLDKDIIEKILKKISLRSLGDVENTEKIYILITNPKGGIDINSKIYNNYLLEWFINTDDVGKFKHLIENYNAKLNTITSHGIRLGVKLLYSCIYYERYKVAELLLGYITINKHDRLMKQLYDKDVVLTDFYKLFIKNGLSIDEVDKTTGYTSLIKSIQQFRKDKFDFFIEQNADVNYLTTNNYTPLRMAAIFFKNNTYYIKKLLENGADVHFILRETTMEDNKVFENISILQEVIYEEYNIEIVKLLLEYGADKNHKETTTDRTALDIAKDKYNSNKKYYGEVIKLLGGKIPEKTSNELWKGFSRSDIEKFDIFFENPFDWSCCPICLEYIERSEACMYMSHNCATTGHYYHEKLYDAYMHNYGKNQVEWCTVCGRITEHHKHFILTNANNPNKTKAKLKPEIQAQLDRGDNFAFFDNANCIGFGGGGIEEKAERFRRLREYALELQEDIGKKSYDDVMEKLIEVVWDSALVKSEKVKKILEDKKWNINVSAFPENKKNTRNNNNSNAANVPFGGRKPTVKEGGDCIIYADDEEGEASNPTYQFHHETVGGIDHDGIYICQKDLAKAVQLKCKDFGLENFGQCWFSQCKGILHPEEVKGIIPEVLYEEYRKKFNKKMVKSGGKRTTRKIKKQRGGNVKSVLHELKDGTCAPPNLTRNGKLRK
jgi:hypothetical protein